MAAAEPTKQETEQERIERWRAGGARARRVTRLRPPRCSPARADVDLHFAIDLLRNGCAPELALQILL